MDQYEDCHLYHDYIGAIGGAEKIVLILALSLGRMSKPQILI